VLNQRPLSQLLQSILRIGEAGIPDSFGNDLVGFLTGFGSVMMGEQLLQFAHFFVAHSPVEKPKQGALGFVEFDWD